MFSKVLLLTVVLEHLKQPLTSEMKSSGNTPEIFREIGKTFQRFTEDFGGPR